jgi:hypothetical protein
MYENDIHVYYILSSNKGIFVWPIWPEANCPYVHTTGKITGYWITTRSFPYQGHMGLDFVSGQYGCLFSRCRKYVINSLIHGHFHIGLVIIPRPILILDSVSGQYGGLGMITRPIWKCPCINLFVYHSIISKEIYIIHMSQLKNPSIGLLKWKLYDPILKVGPYHRHVCKYLYIVKSTHTNHPILSTGRCF